MTAALRLEATDSAAEIILAWPNLISARAYRRNHFAHHRYLNTAQDPDWARRQGDTTWVFPKHWSRLTLLMLRDLSGLGAIYYLKLALMLLSNSTIVPFGQSFWCSCSRVTTSPELWTSMVNTLMD